MHTNEVKRGNFMQMRVDEGPRGSPARDSARVEGRVEGPKFRPSWGSGRGLKKSYEKGPHYLSELFN
jgi:hypothetical protein